MPKSSVRIEAYGTVDELNSSLGLVRDCISDEHSREILFGIQNLLFTIGSHLAADPLKSHMQLPSFSEADVALLEKEMDRMNEELPELMHFILPGGHPSVSQCHIARTVCRRAERRVVELAEGEEAEPLIVKYLNRLSDYLFVLSRKIAKDNGSEELKWIPARY